MAGYLINSGSESVTLPVTVVRMLEQKGDGDAALLYLALLRHQGTVPPRALAGELRWAETRFAINMVLLCQGVTKTHFYKYIV